MPGTKRPNDLTTLETLILNRDGTAHERPHDLALFALVNLGLLLLELAKAIENNDPCDALVTAGVVDEELESLPAVIGDLPDPNEAYSLVCDLREAELTDAAEVREWAREIEQLALELDGWGQA